MSSPERAELRGALLGPYRIGACIGVGGTGVVFEARRLRDGYPVVVKTLRPMYAHKADLAVRLRREGEIARAVAHPGIVPVLDEGLLPDGSPFIVMEKLAGESLGRLMRRSGILGVAETCAIAVRVSAVLHAAHARGYVHRDIKPEHVLLDADPHGALTVHVLDFGVAAAATAPEDERERERGRVFGTPTYVSPEQASGNPYVDGRADLWGLGIVMFEALTGRVPFTGSNVAALLRRIIREDAPRVGLVASHVDVALDEVVARALARDTDARWPSARAFARALAPFTGPRVATERLLAARLRTGSAAPDGIETVRDAAAAA
jgi:serine/threonine-protein kinase